MAHALDVYILSQQQHPNDSQVVALAIEEFLTRRGFWPLDESTLPPVRWGDPGVTYRPVPSVPGYYAGDDGSIWSLLGRVPVKRKQVRTGRNRDRLVVYVTNDTARKRQYLKQVHHLVLEAFVGPRPPGLECCHNDGNSMNNKPGNLRWDTHQANMEDLKRHRQERKERLRRQSQL